MREIQDFRWQLLTGVDPGIQATLKQKIVSCLPGGERKSQFVGGGGGGGVTVFRKYCHLFKVSNEQLLRP